MHILKPLPGLLPMPGHPLADAVALWPSNSLGNKIFDLSGNGNTCTLVNNAAWTSGKFGHCIAVPGSTDYISSVNNVKDFVGSNPRTVSIWFRPTSLGARIILRSGITANGQFFGIFYHFSSATNGISFQGWGSAYDLNGNADTITLNAWNHVAVTWRSGISEEIKIFVNGVKDKGGNIATLNTPATPVHWGRNIPGYAGLIGYLDLPMIWNRDLFASEIALLYREQSCMFPKNIMSEFGMVA